MTRGLSFYYDAKEDAPRATAELQPSEYYEELTYENPKWGNG